MQRDDEILEWVRSMPIDGEAVSVDRLGARVATPDETEKWIVKDAGSRPVWFVALSSASYPHQTREAVTRSLSARDALPERAKAAIWCPAHHGTWDGKSYAVWPYRKPMSLGGLTGRLQRHRALPRVSQWLMDVAAAATVPFSEEVLEVTVRDPLARLAASKAFEPELRHWARAALDMARDGRWNPRLGVCHNDLWRGNVLVEDSFCSAVYLIDWGAAETSSCPLYDLLRCLDDFGVGHRQATALLKRYMDCMGLPPVAATAQGIASLSQIWVHRRQWPEEACVKVVQRCAAFLLRLRESS